MKQIELIWNLSGKDLERVHRFYCTSCNSSALYTDQEYKTALIPLDRVKCVCGRILTHRIEYKKKSWVDNNLREIKK